MIEKIKKTKNVTLIIILTIINILLIITAVLFTIAYSGNIKKTQEKNMLETFKDNVETMKQISERYLNSELDSAKSWAMYVQEKHMTLNEAITYVSIVDDDTNGEAHFVDMDTFEAWSTFYANGSNEILVYKDLSLSNDEHEKANLEIMKKAFNGEKVVLSRYKPSNDSQRISIAVGTKVNIKIDEINSKDYLLLRVIPIERMKQLWLFPTTFSSAEIGLIATNADYVVPSNSMRSNTFMDYVRYYNFSTDYYGADNLLAQLKEKNNGLLTLNDYKKQSSYWYYSKLDNFKDVDVLGYIPVASLVPNVESISIVIVVAGLIFLLVLIDGIYILNVNHRLKEAAQMADKANRSKTQFLSTMSHDIRTPLNAVLGMTELAQNKIDDKEYVRECLRKISVSGNHLLTLINDVLEISRVESGKININPAAFDVKSMISSLESITKSQAMGHGLRFEIKADELPYPTLIGDKLRLMQVYLNLLNNAVKYTRAGGKVYMEMKEEALNEDGSLNFICIIKDTGVGISEDFQKKMYESFTRVEDGRIDKIQGAGLGLSIVKRMVELMNGTIKCESVIDKGTTFTVCIPLTIATDYTESSSFELPVLDDSKDFVGIHALIAEDNEINWEIISSILENYGIICDRTENGQECVDKLIAEIPGTYDLVFMDVQMPVMNGLDATRYLRSCNRLDLQQIPIIAMTADAFAEDIQNCIDAGMNAHIAKPIEIDKVLSTIRRLLTLTNVKDKK